jgi:hypothetical protein
LHTRTLVGIEVGLRQSYLSGLTTAARHFVTSGYLVPHADSERFPAALGDKRDFVLESSEVLLLTKLTAVFQVSITEAPAVASFAVSL